jgi:hypothetical protein
MNEINLVDLKQEIADLIIERMLLKKELQRLLAERQGFLDKIKKLDSLKEKEDGNN